MGFGLTLSTGSLFRKSVLSIFVGALAAITAVYGFAYSGLEQLVFPQNASEPQQLVWVGGLTTPASSDPHTPSDALTSASYLLPQEKPENLAAISESACPADASCAAKAEKVSHPPHKSQRQAAATPSPAKRQVIASALEAKPADAPPQAQKDQPAPPEASKSTGWLDWSKIGDRLPKTDTLLKPFSVVSDAVSGLMKRF